MNYNFDSLRQPEDINKLVAEYERFADSELLHTHDGPVARFSAISRAMEILAKPESYTRYFGPYNHEDIANCLDMALTMLEEQGDRQSTEFGQLGY